MSSNVVYDGHSAESLGDVSHIGNVGSGNGGGSGGDKDLAKSHSYHFKETIQIIEDGLQEAWKEQNKNINKNREHNVSSLTDAKFRKLATTMMFPVSQAILTFLGLIFGVPLLLSIYSKSNGFIYGGIAIGLLLLCSILFDAYIIYRSRKYVVEAVTNRYYKIVKNSWKAYESFSLLCLVLILVMASYFISTEAYSQFHFDAKILNKILSFFDFSKYFVYMIFVGIIYFFTYYMFVYKLSIEAQKAQRISIIEARSASEINADVASEIFNDTLDDFEGHKR
jgi:hypothetical protein